MGSTKQRPRATGATRGTYLQYTEAEREAIARDAVALGVTEAAGKHGTHDSDVSRWSAQYAARQAAERTTERRSRARRTTATVAATKSATRLRQTVAPRTSGTSRTRKDARPTSVPCVEDLGTLRDQEILDEWKRHPSLGLSQIRNPLRRNGIEVPVHMVRFVMQSDGYRPPRVQRHPHDQRFEAV